MSKLTKVAHKIFGSLASYGQLGKVGSFKNGSPAYAVDIATSESLNIEEIQSYWFWKVSIVFSSAKQKTFLNCSRRRH